MLIILGVLLILSFVVTACQPAAPAAEEPAAEKPAAEEPVAVEPATEVPKKVLKVGLLTHGPVHDQGWNDSAYAGLMAIKEQLGAEVSFAELADPSAYEKGYSDFASQGYDVVIGHGYAFNAPAIVVAKSYPNTLFLTSGGDQSAPNVAPLLFREEQPMYLTGLIGGLMSETHKGAGIGGQEIPSVSMPLTGFKAGFESISGSEVSITYINSWTDIATGKEAALAAIATGADILTHVADLAGQGVFQAAEEKDIWAFGTNTDQSSLAPTVILASTTYDYGSAFVAAAKSWQDGTFEGNKPYVIGLENEKACNIVYNTALLDKIPDDVKTKVEEAREKIKSGEIVVPGGYIE